MSEAEIIDRISKLLVSAQDQLWDAGDIADYIKRRPNFVREKLVPLPDFPAVYRLPVEGRAQPLYKASEVRAWIERCREKKSA